MAGSLVAGISAGGGLEYSGGLAFLFVLIGGKLLRLEPISNGFGAIARWYENSCV